MGKKKKMGPAKEKTPATSRKVSFFSWFEKAKKEHKLRDYQTYAIQVFFEKHGLKEVDEPEKFDEMIKKF